MSYEAIRRCGRPTEPPRNFDNYRNLRESFSWAQVRAELEGLPAGGLNIAHEALDRHVAAGRGTQLAMRFIARDWTRTDFSYARLARLSGRFANVLEELGVVPGDTVFTLAGRTPELFIAMFGTFKARAVFCPLCAAFGPEPIQARLEIGGGRVLVTTLSLYVQTVMPMRDELPQLEHVLLTDVADSELPPGTQSFARLMDAAPDTWEIPPTDPEATALLHFTSETTGRPRGALHAHEAVVAHLATGRYVLDFKKGDVFWCTSDPGWVSGIAYGAIAPLVNGVSTIFDQEEFDPERCYRILQEEGVNVWYTSASEIRKLMTQGNALATSYSYRHLRHIASVGGPLNRNDVLWGVEIFGIPFCDTWWQPETGAIMIANFRGSEVRPGSMGRPVPGVEVAIVRLTPVADGGEPAVEEITAPGVEGELALKPGWPSMFRGYLDEPRYKRCFAGGWYLSGDMAKRDADGWYWLVGRSDDGLA